MVDKLKNYINTSVEEIKKVNWPTKRETYNYTLVVIGISIAVAVFLYALDQVFSSIIKVII